MRRSNRLGAICALLLASGAPEGHAGVSLEDAVSMIDLFCSGVAETIDDETTAGFYDCERAVTNSSATGTTRAEASTGFGEILTTDAHTECFECPAPPSTLASSRISFQLSVTQRGSPPVAVATVPVRLVTEGEVGVSNLGFLAGGGTYLSSTRPTVPFTVGDVFEHTMRTNSDTGPVFADDYALTETVDLLPDQVYFGNVFVGCNQFSSVPGSWACSGRASVVFSLDQAAFDASRGEQTFDLAQYFAIERSPNLVPEPSADLLAFAAIGAALVAKRTRRT